MRCFPERTPPRPFLAHSFDEEASKRTINIECGRVGLPFRTPPATPPLPPPQSYEPPGRGNKSSQPAPTHPGIRPLPPRPSCMCFPLWRPTQPRKPLGCTFFHLSTSHSWPVMTFQYVPRGKFLTLLCTGASNPNVALDFRAGLQNKHVKIFFSQKLPERFTAIHVIFTPFKTSIYPLTYILSKLSSLAFNIQICFCFILASLTAPAWN